MSFRLSWQGGRPADEDVVMEDVESWIPSDMVWKAGRQLSAWLKPTLLQTISGQAWPSQDSTPYPGCLQSGECTTPQIVRPTALINTLPPEILGEIFFHYVHDRSSQSFSFPPETWRFGHILAYKGARTNPIVLGHICSHWRVISLAIPTLWSTIYAYKPRFRDIPLFSLWLERSGTCPLDLTIIQSFTESSGIDLAAREVLSDAISQRQRWRSIHLQLLDGVEDLFCSFQINPPIALESAHLNICGWPEETADQFYRTVYASPSLRQLRWGNSFSNYTGVPWQKLQRVELNRLTSIDLLRILPNCSRIEYLSVSFLEGHGTIDGGPNLRLPYLRTLNMDMAHDFCHFIDHLELPSLTDLRLPSGFGLLCIPGVGWASLSALLQRSKCQLQTFAFHEDNSADDLFATRLEPLSQTLRHLFIESTVTDTVIAALTQTPESKLLPLLESIELRDCCSTDGVLSAMIISRTNTSAPETRLKYVKVRLRGLYFGQDLALQVPGVSLDFNS